MRYSYLFVLGILWIICWRWAPRCFRPPWDNLKPNAFCVNNIYFKLLSMRSVYEKQIICWIAANLSHFIFKLKHRLQAIHTHTNCLSSFPPSLQGEEDRGRCGGVHEQTQYLSLRFKYVSSYLYQNVSPSLCRISTTLPKLYNQLWDTSEHCFWHNFIKEQSLWHCFHRG